MSEVKAVVVLSGGQDSTTVLYHAIQRHEISPEEIVCFTVNYGQRHDEEVKCARNVASLAGVFEHEVLELPQETFLSTSPLVSSSKLEQYANPYDLPDGIEKTFIPYRNQLFLTLAANRAAHWGAKTLFTGVCQEDYGGYPDCRQVYITSLEQTCRAAMDTQHFFINTPLMNLSKMETVLMAIELDGCLDALCHTMTAYDGNFPPIGRDHATLLREKGFLEADFPDPLWIRAMASYDVKWPKTENYSKGRLEKIIANEKLMKSNPEFCDYLQVVIQNDPV